MALYVYNRITKEVCRYGRCKTSPATCLFTAANDETAKAIAFAEFGWMPDMVDDALKTLDRSSGETAPPSREPRGPSRSTVGRHETLANTSPPCVQRAGTIPSVLRSAKSVMDKLEKGVNSKRIMLTGNDLAEAFADMDYVVTALEEMSGND